MVWFVVAAVVIVVVGTASAVHAQQPASNPPQVLPAVADSGSLPAPLPSPRSERLPPVTGVPTDSGGTQPEGALVSYQAPDVMIHRIAELEARVRELEDQSKQTVSLPEPQSEVLDGGRKMQAIWNYGLDFESENKDFKVHIGGRTQYDNSFFSNDPNLVVPQADGGIGPQPDSFQFRRGRLRIDGFMYTNFEFAAEYDFVNTLAPASPNAGQPVVTVPGLTDLWGTFTHLPYMQNFRFGNMKEPIGMEHLNSSRFLPFIERSFIHDAVFGPFNNGFTPGVMFFGMREDQLATWAIGWFSAQNSIFGYGIGDESALTARATSLPYYDEPSEGRYLLHLGAGISIRGADENQARVRTRGNIRSGPPGVLNPIYADTGNMAAEMMNILGLETAFNYGSFTMQAEFAGIQITDAEQPYQPPAVPVDRGDVYFYGGYVEALYFLTGEHMNYNKGRATFDRVIPFENFFLFASPKGTCRGRGAWQLGARYDGIKLNDKGINGGILHGFTFGLNWYWNPNSKFQFNYDLTHRSNVQDVPSGFINGWGLRYAMDF